MPMTTNPLATRDQQEVEDIALRLLKTPAMERARTIADMLWRNAVAWPARDQMDRFDNMIEEYLFHYAMRAANGDAAYPRVARFMAPAHHWFGRDVPGSRWAGDSPDFIYRLIPIEHGGRYEIIGRKTCDEAPTVNYALMGDSNAAPVTQGLLDSLDMDFEADGSFAITVDDQSADGRRNHLQTRLGADHILIRDALGDWMRQSANALTVRRLNTDGRAPLTEEALAQRASKNLLEGLYYSYYCTRSGSGQPPNEIRAPLSSGAFGGMATQCGTKGNLDLGPDDAFVVTVTAAGARFRNVMLTDNFHMSLNYWWRTSSFNMVQMAPDADGRYTYVVAHQDPGTHNWLDTNGLRETIFGHRWQASDRSVAPQIPELTARLVRLDDLDKALPPGVARIDTAGRAAQRAAREAGFQRRFVDR
jgi:hypothetical protein